MRARLAELRRSGITRATFAAIFRCMSQRDILVLEHVIAPNGSIGHIYIRPEHWRGEIPYPGEAVVFEGSIEPYVKDGGEWDLGLFRCEVVA